MAINTKAIKRRIKSIGSTKKITKAMEMISAVKMRRAVNTVLASRHYAKLAWEMLTAIAATTDVTHHPLLATREVKKVGVVLITSNRGLAGGFSSRLLQAAHDWLKINGGEADIILTGRRGKKIFTRFGYKVIAEFEKIDLTTRVEEILPLTQMVIKDYVDGKYDKVMLAYTDYGSAILQTPRLKQILPIVGDSTTQKISDTEYLFEPDPKAVLEILLPRLVEMQIYQALLESDASEHSARMVAMKNATDAAADMIKKLRYNFNKARQAAITQEIAEIVGGAAALG